jgi:endonuclease YncB( thermonuclease family)
MPYATALSAGAYFSEQRSAAARHRSFVQTDIGDTVKFGKQRVRLFGIDAPEKAQPCDDGKWFQGRWRRRSLCCGLLCRQGRPPGADVSAGWSWA